MEKNYCDGLGYCLKGFAGASVAKFDYQAEADKTCSIEWGPGNINRAHLLRDLKQFADLAQTINLYKKLLFRGKTPDDLGMRKPHDSESLNGTIAPHQIDLAHGVIGIATEAGEAVEILIALIEGTPPDLLNAVEECGDLRWYINRVLRWADTTDEVCERANIAKLHGRGFADGFDMFSDSNRDLDNESAILAATIDADGEIRVRDDPSLPLGPHGDEDPQDDRGALFREQIAEGWNKGVAVYHIKTPFGDCEGMDC